MHVWLVNHYALPPTEPGGTRHHALARYLIRRGHEVTIIAGSFNHATGRQRDCIAGKVCTFEQFDEVPFLWLRVPGYRNNVSRLWNMLVFAFELWVGVGTRKLRKPDVIIGSSLTLFAAAAAERLAQAEKRAFRFGDTRLMAADTGGYGYAAKASRGPDVWIDRTLSVSPCG